MKLHEAKRGDCIESIAHAHGHLPETIWEDDQNAALRDKRKDDRNVLAPGDSVAIPEREPKQEERATGQRHRFRRKAVPTMLRIKFGELAEEQEDSAAWAARGREAEAVLGGIEGVEEKPYAHVPYILRLVTASGAKIPDVKDWTDGDGWLVKAIPPDAVGGEVVLDPGKVDEVVPFQLGEIDPVHEGLSGVQGRLESLGYEVGQPGDTLNDETREAVQAFQERQGLAVLSDDAQDVDDIDQDTRDALEKAFSGAGGWRK